MTYKVVDSAAVVKLEQEATSRRNKLAKEKLAQANGSAPVPTKSNCAVVHDAENMTLTIVISLDPERVAVEYDSSKGNLWYTKGGGYDAHLDGGVRVGLNVYRKIG